MKADLSRETRIRVGPLLLWLGDGSWSFHVGALRVLWVKDSRRWFPLLSDRHHIGHVRWFGPWIVRWWEPTYRSTGGGRE